MMAISEMEFRRIELTDRSRMECIRRGQKEILSTYSFPVLYCWQDVLGFSIHMGESAYLIRYAAKGKRDFCFPIGSWEECCGLTDKLLLKYSELNFHFVNEANVEKLKEKYGIHNLSISEDRDSFDYMGVTKEFAELKGQKYRAIRKHINRLEKEENLCCYPVVENSIQEVKQISEIWNLQNEQGKFTDKTAEDAAINSFSELGLEGFLVKNAEKSIGFLLGTKTREDTFQIHFMKKITEISGLDFYMVNNLCREMQREIIYFNMEDDMGNEGIRSHKQLFKPDFLQKSYSVVLKGKE